MTKSTFHIVFLLIIMQYSPVMARDISVADSCITVLNTAKNLTALEKCELLFNIVTNSTPNINSLEYSGKLISEAEAINNSYYLFYGYHGKGQYLTYSGQLEEGIDKLLFALKIAKANKMTEEEGFTYYAVSEAYLSVANYKNALEYAEKALEIFMKNEIETYIASAYYQIASIHLSSDSHDSALIYFKKAKEEFIKADNQHFLAYTLGNIGYLHSMNNEHDSARINLNQALIILEKTNDFEALVTNLLFSGNNELGAGNFKTALSDASRAYVLSQKLNNPQRNIETYEQLCLIYAALGDYQNAYNYQRLYYQVRDSLVNLERVTHMANMKTLYEVGLKQTEVDKLTATNKLSNIILAVSLFALIIAIVLLALIHRHYKYKKRLNSVLIHQKEKLKNRAFELQGVNNSKDRLFGIIAHDLRGPVSAITNLAELISESIVEQNHKEAHELSLSMGEAGRQVEFLLNNLLHWSINQQNIYVANTEVFDIVELVGSIKKVYDLTAVSKNVALGVTSEFEMLRIKSDPNTWGTIIRNLVNNALKFTPSGGRVLIDLQIRNNSIKFSVSDTGIGMSAQEVDRLFTSDNMEVRWGTQNEKGQGLGLCLVKDFVEINNGHIEVVSKPNKGTTFVVFMPFILIEKREISTISLSLT